MADPFLRTEWRYELSKLIPKLSKAVTRITFKAEEFNKIFKITNQLYEWHVTQNHFPDTRGHHCYGGRISLMPALPPLSFESPAATPTVECVPSFDWDAFECMITDSCEMCYSIRDFYFNQNDFMETRYDWTDGRVILFDTWPKCVPRGPCSYQDYLDTLFVFDTCFTAFYEQCKHEHKMMKEMYDWHLGQNHFTEKCHVILSKL